MNTFVKVTRTTTCNCVSCAPVPAVNLGMPYEKEEKKAAKTKKGRSKLIVGENDLVTMCPKAAAMWSDKNSCFPCEVCAGSGKKVLFVCPDCKQEFEAQVCKVVESVKKGRTGCPVCKVIPGINDFASQCPEAAAMWSDKNTCFPGKVHVGSNKKAWFVCPDCKQEFETHIHSVAKAVKNGHTSCYDCNMQRLNVISKPEWFFTMFMLAFSGKNGIANPFFDVRNILGENSFYGLDFVDHTQELCYEYNGNAWHGDDKLVARDRFKFEAAHKAGYTMIRVLEPGLEILDSKYDIVLSDNYYRSGKYNAVVMEEAGRKVIHLLEEITVVKLLRKFGR